MRVNTDKLRGKMVEHRFTVRRLSEELGLNESTFYRKLNSDGLDFSVGEMHRVVDALELTNKEACEIFLDRNSQ